MVVSVVAVRKFLSRKLRDLDGWKRVSEEVLDAHLADLDPPPVFHTKPWKRQKIAFLVAAKRNVVLRFGTGSGKSKIALDLLRWKMAAGRAKRALILVPNAVNLEQWIDEGRIHAPDFRGRALDVSGEDNRRAILMNDGYDFVVATYAGFLSLCSTPMPAKKGKKKEWVLDEAKIDAIAPYFGFAVYDESDAFKSSQSLTFKLVRKLSTRIPERIALVGKMFHKTPEDLWSQFFAIDRGDALGDTLGIFRASFFEAKPRYWGMGYDYKVRKDRLEDLARAERHSSIFYGKNEDGDLPPVVGGVHGADFSIVHVGFTPETEAYYRKVVEELIEAKGNFRLLESAYVRLRQIASGFLPVVDPSGNRQTIVFREQPKIDALKGLVREIPEDEKFIVVCYFQESGEPLLRALREEKISTVRLAGGMSDPGAIVERFRKDPKVRALVTSTAGARGLNLQMARSMLFYESPDSAIVRHQIESRIVRSGQTAGSVLIRDLVVRHSVEERILKSLRDGEDLTKRLDALATDLAAARKAG